MEERFEELTQEFHCLLDRKTGRILHANGIWKRELGWDPEKLRRRPFSEMLLESDSPRVGKLLWSLVAGERAVRFLAKHATSEGQWRLLEWQGKVLDTEEIALIGTDLTGHWKAESDQQARILLDLSLQFVGLLDPEGHLIDVNRTALDFVKVKSEEVLGLPFWDCPWWTHSKTLQERLQLAVQRAAQGASIRMEVTHRSGDGELMTVEFSLRPVFDASGKVVMLIPEGRDISDRKRVEEQLSSQEQKFKSLFHSMSEGVALHEIVHGPNGRPVDYRIVDVNPAYEKITDLPRALVVGKLGSEVYESSPPPYLDSFVSVAAEGQPHYFETYHEPMGRYLAISVSPWDPDGFATIFFDITDRILMSRANEDARAAAEKANLAKSQFLANMSHEIRTPMNGVLGMAYLLSETTLDENQRDYLNIISQSGEYLLEVIDDLLDLSRLEVGAVSINRRPMSVHELASYSLNVIRPKVQEKRLRLNLAIGPDVPRRILGDRKRLIQVLVNLLVNAVKFTERGGIELTVDLLKQDSMERPWIHFLVRDSGSGIEEPEKERIFDRFYQTDMTRTKPYKGLGLGLSICRHLVELMGGSISVDSRVGEGSCFHVLIPWTPASEAEEELTEGQLCRIPRDPVTTAGKILVVDDNPSSCYLLCEAIRRDFPYMICEKRYSGTEGLEAFLQLQPDLIFLDIQMPDMTGIEVAAAIRAQTPSEWIPPSIVALSGSNAEEEADDLKAIGIDKVLIKPIPPREVRRMVQWAFQRH